MTSTVTTIPSPTPTRASSSSSAASNLSRTTTSAGSTVSKGTVSIASSCATAPAGPVSSVGSISVGSSLSTSAVSHACMHPRGDGRDCISTGGNSTGSGGVGAGKKSRTKWQRLISTLRLKRRSSDSLGGDASFIGQGFGTGDISGGAYRLKHSHNCSNAFLKAGISNMKGFKKSNQDRCTAFSYMEADTELSFFAVYDGHGGTGVANYLKDHLHEYILNQPEYKEGNMEEAILKAFLQTDSELRTYGQATELTGSTASVIMIKNADIICANLGDSRAIASVLGLVKPLTCDHNTGNAKERERIFAMGGSIKENRVGGVLIPTRAFGDFLLKSEMDKPAWKQVISVIPQISSFKLNSHWDFVVIASDGVWDAVTNAEMIKMISDTLNQTKKNRDDIVLSEVCEQILDQCCNRMIDRYGKNSCDNMTLIIVWLDILHGQ